MWDDFCDKMGIFHGDSLWDLSDLTNKNVDLTNKNRDLTVDYRYVQYSYVNYQRIHIDTYSISVCSIPVVICYRLLSKMAHLVR